MTMTVKGTPMPMPIFSPVVREPIWVLVSMGAMVDVDTGGAVLSGILLRSLLAGRDALLLAVGVKLVIGGGLADAEAKMEKSELCHHIGIPSATTKVGAGIVTVSVMRSHELPLSDGWMTLMTWLGASVDEH